MDYETQEMIMKTIYTALEDYLNLKTNLSDCEKVCGKKLLFFTVDKPILVKPFHVITLIQAYLSGEINIDKMLEWVNIIWFSEGFDFDDEHVDSIVSVIDQLECLDEDNATFTTNDYKKMIECLEVNVAFECRYI